MIKKTLYFGNPVYLSLRNAQLIIKLPDVEKTIALPEVLKKQAEVTKPIEDIGIIVLDNKQITITSGVLEAVLQRIIGNSYLLALTVLREIVRVFLLITY